MKTLFAFLALGLALLAPAAAEPHITGLEVAFDDVRVLLDFRLEEAFDQRFLERLEAGLPSGFVYRFQIVRARKVWFDNTLASGTLEVMATYDAVKQEYLVNYRQEGKLVRSRLVRNLEELEQAMTRFESEPVLSTEKIQGRRRLRMRMRAELGPKTLLLLIPSKITTPWVETPLFDLPVPAP